MSFKHKLKKLIKFCINTKKEEKIIPIMQPTDLKILNGKVALITGGSSGIGFAIANSFIRSGCRVIIAGTNEDKLKKCVQQLGEFSRYIVINVMDVQSIPEKVFRASTIFGQIDILVNSAGIIEHSSFGNITEEEYDKVMGVNIKGTFFMSQAVTNYMLLNKLKGHILNVSSSSALRPAWTPYQMSKWAVRGFTSGLADNMIKYGIVVNAIAPGQTATPMLGKKEGDSLYHANCPAGRYITSEEVANLATFMVSAMGDMIVGDTFYITGGSGTISMHK